MHKGGWKELAFFLIITVIGVTMHSCLGTSPSGGTDQYDRR